MPTTFQLETANRLLREILENNSDDEIRLIYADLLEDMGQDDRANFIRLHLQLEKISECVRGWQRLAQQRKTLHYTCESCRVVSNQYPVLEDTFNRLISSENGSDFFKAGWRIMTPLTTQMPERFPDYPVLYLRRGFCFCASGPIQALCDALPDLLKRHPIEHVFVTDRRPQYYIENSHWRAHWSWWCYPGTPDPGSISSIEKVLFDKLTNTDYVHLTTEAFSPFPQQRRQAEVLTRNYFNHDRAMDSLNKAVLRYYKELVFPPDKQVADG